MKNNKLILILLWMSVTVSGCAAWSTARTVLHPISGSDIQPMKAGECYTPEKPGYFLSDLYLKEVVQAKVEQKSK